MDTLSELFKANGYSAPATDAAIADIATAPTATATATQNLNATVNIENATANAAASKAETALTFIGVQQQLDQQQIASQRDVNSKVSELFGKTDTLITEQLNHGFDAAQRATEAQAQAAQLAEEQNQTFNPLKKALLWWKRSNVEDTAANAATEASAFFKSAQVAGDVTSQQIQQTISRNTMAVGLEQQARQAEKDSLLKATLQEQAVYESLMGDKTKQKDAVLAAKMKYFDAQAWETSRKYTALQMKQMNQSLQDLDNRARFWLKLNGVTSMDAQSLAAARDAVSKMQGADSEVFTRAMVLARSGDMAGVINGLRVTEVQSLGKYIPALANFGQQQFTDSYRSTFNALVDQDYKKYTQELSTGGNKLSKDQWLVNALGKESVKNNKELALATTQKDYESMRAVDLLQHITPNANLPATFDIARSSTALDGVAFSGNGILPADKAKLAASSFQYGQPGYTTYSKVLAETQSKLNQDEAGIHVQFYAMTKTLKALGIAKTDAEATAQTAKLFRSAAASSTSALDDTAKVFQMAGFQNPVIPKVITNFGGLQYDLTNPVDAGSIVKQLEGRLKTLPTWSVTGDNKVNQGFQKLVTDPSSDTMF